MLEAVAMNAASDGSLRLLGQAWEEGREVTARRIVIVADIPESSLGILPGGEHLPTARFLEVPCVWKHVVSIHVDDEESESLVRGAAREDDSAFEALTEEDLMWYDVAERTRLARLLACEE